MGTKVCKVRSDWERCVNAVSWVQEIECRTIGHCNYWTDAILVTLQERWRSSVQANVNVCYLAHMISSYYSFVIFVSLLTFADVSVIDCLKWWTELPVSKRRPTRTLQKNLHSILWPTGTAKVGCKTHIHAPLQTGYNFFGWFQSLALMSILSDFTYLWVKIAMKRWSR